MGATTIWERWDSMRPDGSINPGEMTSFNHYALGAVADWIHRAVGGIAPLEPGYAKVLIAPRPGGGLTWARASLATRHGLVEVHWRQAGHDLVVEVAVPPGTTVSSGCRASRAGNSRPAGTRSVSQPAGRHADVNGAGENVTVGTRRRHRSRPGYAARWSGIGPRR